MTHREARSSYQLSASSLLNHFLKLRTEHIHATVVVKIAAERKSVVCRQCSAVSSPRELLIYHFDLLIQYFAGEAIDRYVHPIMLLPFHDEIVSETSSIWLVVTGLGCHID